MRGPLAILIILFFMTSVAAGPVIEMNRAFLALADLIPFLTKGDSFMAKKNEKIIQGKIAELQIAFKSARHNTVLKKDLFAPSYAVINESISNSSEAFKEGKKDYAKWRLKEITTHCLDCHTKLPPSYTSSFQNGELSIDEKKFTDIYNLGIAQLIVRRYVDAKNSFIRSIQDRMITKDFRELLLPFKQILVIETKVLKNPESANAVFKSYVDKKELPEEVRKTLSAWISQLSSWEGKGILKTGLKDDKALETFIKMELLPLKMAASLGDASDIDLLFTSGLLSNYLFENPSSKMAPDISYWLGWAEKHLKRDDFFGSGDLFLKQCIKKYPKHPMAKKCLDEYRESLEFEFSGSSGTQIPADVEKELLELSRNIKKK